jgi:RNA polymerase-binding transcription factor DksA
MRTNKKKTAAKAPSRKHPAKAVKAAKPKTQARVSKPAKPAKPAKPKAVKSRPAVKSKTAKAPKSAKHGRKQVLCEFCGAEIPPERIEALPETSTCIECSQTKPYSEAQIVGLNGEDAEPNRINADDFEEADTDFSSSYGDQW